MFVYEKELQYPVRITRPDPAMAARIVSQYGGPDGELGASLRYLSQRYAMPCGRLKGLLTDVGVEELGHLEIVGAMVHQLTRNLCCDDIKKGGFDAYFVDHGAGVYPTSAAGMPYHAAGMQSKGDPITDLHEDLAADAAAVHKQPGPLGRRGGLFEHADAEKMHEETSKPSFTLCFLCFFRSGKEARKWAKALK